MKNNKYERMHLILKLVKEKPRTRQELQRIVGAPDRVIRNDIATINSIDSGPFKDYTIAGFSNGRGYQIAKNQELLKHFIREMKKRQASMDPPITKAERNLKRMENE